MKSANNLGRGPVFLTVREVAWALGVQPCVVHRAIRVGVLRAVWRCPQSARRRAMGRRPPGPCTEAE